MAKNFKSTADKEIEVIDNLANVAPKMPQNTKEYMEGEKQKAQEVAKANGISLGFEIAPAKRKSLIQCYTSTDIKELMKRYADEEGISVNELLNNILTAYLEIRTKSEE